MKFQAKDGSEGTETFGRWTITGAQFFVLVSGRPRSCMPCRCQCGTIRDVLLNNLKRGTSQSCGCLQKEVASAMTTTHGQLRDGAEPGTSKARLYGSWKSMKDRCLNPNDTGYHRYGGRGISVCSEWQNDFGCFREWALSNGYRDDLTIERVDNDGPYCPENCRWATMKEQARNKMGCRWIKAFGESKVVADWVLDPRCVVGRPSLDKRLNLGWDPERAITTPPLYAPTR